MVALAAAALVVLSFQVGRSSAFISPQMRSKLAQPGKGVPPELMVVVSEDGKMFHLPTCTFIHDKAQLRSMTARQAQEGGFAPCVRCMRKYLAETARVETDAEIHEFADAAVSP
jgi:hypothetical protein